MSALLSKWWHTGVVEPNSDPPAPSIVSSARERARLEVLAAIRSTARAQLARDGAAGLSLRAVARELGMVSSNIYRYVPSRDELLTALIIEVFDDLGDHVEQAHARVPHDDLLGRWMAIGQSMRHWALDRPQEWALLYGSPVPGYAAPSDTVQSGTRVSALLAQLLGDVSAHLGEPPAVTAPRAAVQAVEGLRWFLPDNVHDQLIVSGIFARAALIGIISLEVFGASRTLVSPDPALAQAFFDFQLRRLATDVGLAA